MTLLQLSYIIELSRTLSFSETANKLGISQPALSLQVKKLEEELGMQIFKRMSGGVEITTEGDIFITKARELLSLAENMKDLPFELELRPEGHLRLGVIPTLAPYWFPMFLSSFSKKFPKINLTVKELKTDEIIADIKTGLLDAGFISTPVVAQGMKFSPLFYERFYMYISEKHELYKNNLIDLNSVNLKEIWYLSEGNCFQNQVDSICMYAKEPGQYQNVVYLSESIESLSRIVEISGGMTFLPELATLQVSSEKEDMIKEIKGHVPVREISLVTSRLNRSSRLINFFLETALDVIPKRMKIKPDGKLHIS